MRYYCICGSSRGRQKVKISTYINTLQFCSSNRKSMFGGAVPPLSGKQDWKESEPKLYPEGIWVGQWDLGQSPSSAEAPREHIPRTRHRLLLAESVWLPLLSACPDFMFGIDCDISQESAKASREHRRTTRHRLLLAESVYPAYKDFMMEKRYWPESWPC